MLSLGEQALWSDPRLCGSIKDFWTSWTAWHCEGLWDFFTLQKKEKKICTLQLEQAVQLIARLPVEMILHWSFDVDVLCYHGPYKDAICDHRRMACPFKKTLGSTATKASKALDLMDSMAL